MTNILHSLCTCFLLTFMLHGCAEEGAIFRPSGEDSAYDGDTPLALFIGHSEDTSSINLAAQMTRTLDYASIPYLSHDLSSADDTLYIPSTTRIVYVTTGWVDELSNEEMERIIHFVAAGNQVTILKPVYDSRFSFLMGLKYNTLHIVNQQAKGYAFNTEIFPGYVNETVINEDDNRHDGFSGSEFIAKKNVLASAANDSSYPVIIERRIGRGRSMYFNTYQLAGKNDRGLLFSTSLKALEGIPYRVANVSTIFLDDFPAPLYNRKMPPIDEEYDITHAEFVQNVWWPDMKALADSFDINYTALLTFNYNATVVPPFNFDEWEENKFTIQGMTQSTSAWIADDINESRHELGFHGYNHFSLWKKDWHHRGFMEAALRAARKRWIINRPGLLPQSYVPPTNYIDSTGLKSIEHAFPEIKYMSSIYSGDVAMGGDREFGPDPYVPSLFNYPRVSSGFVDNARSNFNQNSLYLYTGIWTHFIHPDDVFQVIQRSEDDYKSRNPLELGWHSNEEHDYGLYEIFRQRLEKTVKTYPFIRFRSVRQSVPVVKKWLNTRSVYHFNDSTLHVGTDPTDRAIGENDQKFWFVYKDKDSLVQFEQSLVNSGIDFAAAGLLEGKLYQFSSTADTLSLPFLNWDYRPEYNDAVVAGAVEQYRSFFTRTEAFAAAGWYDTRLEDALAALEENPASTELQDRVIDLSVEFDRIRIAMPILENRLLTRPEWRTRDIQRLLSYYGWEGAYGRAFSFLEQLWSNYSDQSVVTLKNMMVDQYGRPGMDFQKKWMRRVIALQPENESLLERMILINNSSESWPEQRKYIKRLMELNPRSDTLYHYAFGRVLAYETPPKALEWLRSFPDEAVPQLQPFAGDIAYLYANQGELTRAVIWGRKTDAIPAVTELYWLIQQKRYHDFISRGKVLMEEEPENDSLRAFIGKQLIYERFLEEGYQTLYPLFEQDQTQPDTKELVHAEIGYMNFEQKKRFHNTYPDFFHDSLRVDLNHHYRQNEGFEVGTNTSFAADNFENQKSTVGFYTQWGNRAGTMNRLSIEEGTVSSDIFNNHKLNKLYHLRYRYQRSYSDRGSQFFITGGAYFDNGKTRPDAGAGIWFSRDSSFTSTQLLFEPVFTNHGIQQNVNKINAGIYREDYWLKKNGLQTTLSVNGKWYSDNVFAYVGVFRLYVNVPFSTRFSQLRPVADLSYSDATEKHLFSIPYYTSDNLFKQGVGLNYSYKDQLYSPAFSMGITLMAKHDNRDGIFYSGNARLSARINRYWQLSVDAQLSTSDVYRYNSVNMNVSFLLPKTLTK